MIVGSIISFLWTFAGPLVNRIPDVAINYDGIANSTVYQFLKAACYMLPMDTVHRILSIVLLLWVVRVVIAFLHSVWQALPIV